jgi:hypothetical protein
MVQLILDPHDQNYCEGPDPTDPHDPNYCEGPDPRTLTGSTPMTVTQNVHTVTPPSNKDFTSLCSLIQFFSGVVAHFDIDITYAA